MNRKLALAQRLGIAAPSKCRAAYGDWWGRLCRTVHGWIVVVCLVFAAASAMAATEEISRLMESIPLLSLDEIRRAEDAETVRRAVTWTQHDTEPFYTLLADVASRTRGELTEIAERAVADSVTVRELFLTPEKLRLRAVTLDGIVKRVVETPTSDSVRARWQIDRYYQLYLFPRESDGNPVVACVADLPAGIVTGDAVTEDVRVIGLYYKLWMYESREGRVQVAPVIVTGDVTRFAPPLAAGREWNVNVSFALFAALIGTWIVVRVWQRGRHHDDRREKKTALSLTTHHSPRVETAAAETVKIESDPR